MGFWLKRRRRGSLVSALSKSREFGACTQKEPSKYLAILFWGLLIIVIVEYTPKPYSDDQGPYSRVCDSALEDLGFQARPGFSEGVGKPRRS